MKKHEFIDELTNALLGLGNDEIKKSLDYYCEMIDDAVENGEDEEAVIERLGSVQEIAQGIINETPLGKLVKENVKRHKWSAAEIVLIIITSPVWLPMAAAVLSVGVSLYLSLWSVVASLFITSAALFLGGFALAVSSPFILAGLQGAKALLCLGMGLVCIGASVFLFYFSVLVSKLIIKLSVYCIRKIKKMFIRGGAKNEAL